MNIFLHARTSGQVPIVPLNITRTCMSLHVQCLVRVLWAAPLVPHNQCDAKACNEDSSYVVVVVEGWVSLGDRDTKRHTLKTRIYTHARNAHLWLYLSSAASAMTAVT